VGGFEADIRRGPVVAGCLNPRTAALPMPRVKDQGELSGSFGEPWTAAVGRGCV